MSASPFTVLHASDFQIGRPFLPEAAEALLRLAGEVRPDVVVAAGDITQRAKRREFEHARALLERFGDVPVVVTPGNHDVPLYRVWERAATPYKEWRRFADATGLDSVTRVPGAVFVALNSSDPRGAIVAGRIRSRQVEFAERAFREAPVSDLRVLVVHHHFLPVPDGRGGRPLRGAKGLLAAFESMGVSAILGGHVHQLHVGSSTQLTGNDAGVPVIATGTATSRRGRGPEAGANSVCVLTFQAGALRVRPYRRDTGGVNFEPVDERTFPLRGRPTAAGESTMLRVDA
ncbi:MAG: metallophosphoesterase [Gemmatimonadota bacterium]|nr:metallophosphoesterase [Gemmatimonadota bacterium]